jgi:hypothetical protein
MGHAHYKLEAEKDYKVRVCRLCNKPRPLAFFYKPAGRRTCKSCDLARAKEYKGRKGKATYKNFIYRLRRGIMENYGDGTCACCGESTYEFLTLDHVNGDGHIERKKYGNGRDILIRLRRLGYPDKHRYRILCYNCNCASGFLGYCPHEKSKLHKLSPTRNS